MVGAGEFRRARPCSYAASMAATTTARCVEVHPPNPQRRAARATVGLVREDGLTAYPTASAFAVGAMLGDRHGLERIQTIGRLEAGDHFALVCRDFAQLGQFVRIS